jgi:NTE family protein
VLGFAADKNNMGSGSFHRRQCERIALIFAMVLSLSLLALKAEAAPTPEQARPRVALVLEGGGALGLAHVGVIKWLEEHRIPVDYVAGTSMGGLVGGMYALGNNPQQLEQLVSGLDWSELLSDRLDYKNLSFRRKQDKRDYPNILTLGLNKKIMLPSGLTSGYQIGLLLDRQVLPYSHLSSFDDLPIPFRCVAVDLATRSQYVFRDGSLTQALRATMSIPGIFSPVRDGKHIYVDGGLLNNLPVDVGRAMGADLVIAVHLEKKPIKADQYLSSVGTLGESITVVVGANELRSLANADLLINVDTANLTSTDYPRAAQLVQLGYQAAAQKTSILQRLALDEANWETYLAQRNARRIAHEPVPEFIQAKVASPVLEQAMEESLAKYAGRPLDTTAIKRDLDTIYGAGRFGGISYHMIDRNGTPGLLVEVAEREPSKTVINPLFVVDASDADKVGFLAGARITRFNHDAVGSEWRTDVTAGSQYGLATEYYRPFSLTGKWFVAPRATVDSSTSYTYSGNDVVSEYRVNHFGTGADLGLRLGQDREIRFGYETGYASLSRQIGDNSVPAPSGRIGVTSLGFSLDRLDRPMVPHSGVAFDWTMKYFDGYVGANRGFPATEADALVLRPVNAAGSIYFSAAGGTTFGVGRQSLPLFALGGPLDLAAYRRNELSTNKYAFFRTGYIHQIAELSPLFGHKIYAIALYEGAKLFDIPQHQYPQDMAGGLVIETAFGPILIGGSYGDAGHRKIIFQLGRLF